MTEAVHVETPLGGALVGTIVGRSPGVRKALALVDRFAATPVPVLIVGPTGTGKELFARRVHAKSGRRGAFVAVNCGALPRDMVESLLFGHRRGAFTGALESTTGFIEAADRGTLYLDELSSLSPETQVKLLRVLDSREFHRLGETRSCAVDFRLVASVQEDLADRIEHGAFRLDLYQRVAGVVVQLDSLCDRRDDLPLLAQYFARLRGTTVAPGVDAVLLAYAWPGNVRELRAAIDRALFLSDNGALHPAALAEAIELGQPNGAARPAGKPNGARARLVAICEANGWDSRRVAAALGVHRATLFRRLRQFGLSLRR